MWRRFHLTLVFPLLLSAAAYGADVALVGVTGGRALLTVDGGQAHWLAVGGTSGEGVRLIHIDGENAVVEFEGARRTLSLGENMRLSGAPGGAGGTQSVTLAADEEGNFFAAGMINGVAVRFLVDTGASLISINKSEARRLGINYLQGRKSATSTANGVVPTYRVTLDEVRVGDITLEHVEGMVHIDDALPIALLGLSFLNRTNMHRDGGKMVLTKRF